MSKHCLGRVDPEVAFGKRSISVLFENTAEIADMTRKLAYGDPLAFN